MWSDEYYCRAEKRSPGVNALTFFATFVVVVVVVVDGGAGNSSSSLKRKTPLLLSTLVRRRRGGETGEGEGARARGRLPTTLARGGGVVGPVRPVRLLPEQSGGSELEAAAAT